MAKPFRGLRDRMSPESRERSDQRARELLAEMPLQELRQARQLSQEMMAQALHTSQASVSKIERRTDMYVGTLRRYLQAMGGDLIITARFPEGEVRINQFQDLDDLTAVAG